MKNRKQLPDLVSIDDIGKLKNARTSNIYDVHEIYELGRGRRRVDDRSGCLHPSAVGNCKRAAYYEYFPHPKLRPVDSSLQGIFDLGHAIHDLIQTKFVPYLKLGDPELEVDFVSEAGVPDDDELYDELELGGHTDGVVDLRHARWGWRQRGVLEIKSIGKTEAATLKKPKKLHLMQSHLYAYRWNTPIIWIWYFSKDQGVNIVFPVLFDQAIFEEALEYFEVVYGHVVRKVPPRREVSKFACRNCVFLSICKPPGIHDEHSARKRGAGLSRKLSK